MRKLAFYSFKEIGEIFHVSPATVRNWAWRGYFKVTGYKVVSRGRRIALVSESEAKRLVRRFIMSIEERSRPGRKRGGSPKRKSAPQDTESSNPPAWIKDGLAQCETEDTAVSFSSSIEETSLRQELFTAPEETPSSPREVIRALLQTGSFTLKEIQEETRLEMPAVKEMIFQLKEGGLVVEELTGMADPEEWYCYTIRENHI
jgi:hypothetical protein